MRMAVQRLVALSMLALLAQPGLARVSPQAPRRMAKDVLADRIRGGWAGKMIGVSYGAPTEFRSNGAINDGPITWSPERVSNALGQDDLYVGMTMAETMDRLGFDATVEQYGEAFKDSEYDLWHVYGLAQGPHTLRIVTRADADRRSRGTTISIAEAVVYRAR